MAEADGAVVMFGVALLTVTLTVVVTVLKLVVLLGVNVTLWLAVPALGAVVGVVKAKVPPVDAAPPLSVELASVWPKVMAEADGAVLIVGVVLTTAEAIAT